MEANSLLITFLAQMGVISFALTFCSFVRDRVRGKQSVWRLIVSGLFFGGTAALLMNMSGELLDGFRFDLRIVPLAIVGLIAGPIGAIMAACTASAARLWLGGAGTALGLLGIWLACLVSISGHFFLKRGYIRPSDVLLFSTLNAGIAFLILLVLPQTVRANLSQFNAQYTLLALNFVGTLISASFVRLDQLRRESAHLNELHSQIVSALPDALSVKDLDGRFLIANDPTAVLMGATDGVAMVGKTDFDYYTPEEAALFWKQEQEFLADDKPVVLEQQFNRNGRTYWLSTVKAPYRDERGELKGIVSHTSDVTAQKALQAELISTQVLLETAMDEMADGLAMFDREGRLVMWNRRYVEFFPYVDEGSCQGHTLAELLSAGVLRGAIRIPTNVSPLAWVEEEVERSQSAQLSDLRLSDGRWVSKSTRLLADGGWVTIYSDISDRKAAIQQLERLASKDGLTELANRRIFDRSLEVAFQESRDTHKELSLLLIDVDHFKAYNDTYGHPAGDEALRRIANVLQSGCRGEMDLAARYGGEEFAVVLPNCSQDEAHDVAARFANAVRQLEIPHVGSWKGRVTVSIGLSTTDELTMGCQQLLKGCDEALYAAKSAGRDKVRAAIAGPGRSLAL